MQEETLTETEKVTVQKVGKRTVKWKGVESVKERDKEQRMRTRTLKLTKKS